MEKELKEIIGSFVFNIAQLQKQVADMSLVLIDREKEIEKLKSHSRRDSDVFEFPSVKVNE